MDIDRLTHAVHDGSRRRFLAFSGGAVGALGSLLGLPDAEGKKKRKKKKGNKGLSLHLAYECPGPPETIYAGAPDVNRQAQLFVPDRGGRLRRVQIAINKLENTFGDWHVQFLRASSGVPDHTALGVLAAVTIADAQLPMGDSLLIADFAGPELEAGERYAVAIWRSDVSARVGVYTSAPDACAGQRYFAAGEDAFAISLLAFDIVVSVFVD